MRSIVRALIVLALLVGSSLTVRAFELPGLDKDAAAYEQAIHTHSPTQPDAAQSNAALARAQKSAQSGDVAAAIAAYEQAIAFGADRTETWLALSELWATAAKPDFNRALQAADLGLQAASTPAENAAALFQMGILLEDDLQRPAEALDAYRAAAEQVNLPQIATRLAALTRKVGLLVKAVTVDPDADPPRACVQFSSDLTQVPGTRFADDVAVEPGFDMAVEGSGDKLCIAGFDFNKTYRLTLREGLPGADELSLHKTVVQTVHVGNRQPHVAMRGNAFIMPTAAGDGLPVITVNIGTVGLKVYRINDRNLVAQINQNRLLSNLDSGDAGLIKDQDGQLVWQGKMAVATQPNRQLTTVFQVGQAIGTSKPGIYVITAENADDDTDFGPRVVPARATQWLIETDLALTALRGRDGLHAFVRSFKTAKPVAGVALALVAHNNTELGRAMTDADGSVTFAPGLVRGEGGDAPAAVMAYGSAGDYNLIDLTSASFDFSERGVGGRAAPGPLDAFLYSDRGVYRPGEIVQLAGLLRDDHAQAASGVPLTFKVRRPNGSSFLDRVVNSPGTGFYQLPLALGDAAPLGSWAVDAYADPKAPPIGHLDFAVDDFVPERLKVELTPAAPIVAVGKPTTVAVDSQFLYGAPGAGLAGTAELTLEADPKPYPSLAGYQFGRVGDRVTPRLVPLVLPVADAVGKAAVAIDLADVPDTSLDLQATIAVAVSEPGGRPTRKSISLPVASRAFAIGIKPQFANDQLPEKSDGAFDVIAVDRAGAKVAAPTLRYSFVRERVSYRWYLHDGSAQYQLTVRDEKLNDGDAAVATDAPKVLSGHFDAGRYRLDVFDAASGASSSLRFYAGWALGPQQGDTPDKLDIAADKPSYAVGEIAHLRIAPPFAGELLLTVLATDHVALTRSLSVPAEGATIDIPVSADWGPGAYATATVFRPLVADQPRAPLRAIGLTWLKLDPAPRTLAVALTVPDHVKPRQTIRVPVKVTGTTPANAVALTLAAVDEGILQLTDFKSPDPEGYFFAKRQLAVDVRDDYGRLIDTGGGPVGPLRQGGDSGAGGRGLPVVPTRTVALFSGLIKLDANGAGEIALDLPDFNGQLRLMAVAFDASRIGHAEAALTVRDDVVAEVTLPRFLAPGDQSQATLSLHNVDGAAGQYTLALDASGAVTAVPPPATIDLAAGQRQTLRFALNAGDVGIGRLMLHVKGPNNFAVDRDWSIAVRAAQPVATQFQSKLLQPGDVLKVGATLFDGLIAGTAGLSVSVGSAPRFDVAGLVRALQRYPYGCLEQTISTSFPLVALGDAGLGAPPASPGVPVDAAAARIDKAVSRLLDLQRFDGAFGLWSARDEAEPWLTAYAMEFLTRVRAGGNTVPDEPYAAGLHWLANLAIAGETTPEDLATRAYAHYVLALAGVARPGSLRYFADTFTAKLPTPLAKAQIGGALALVGDRTRAQSAFAAALGNLARDPWDVDYGSTSRDAAAIIVLLNQAQLMPERLPDLIDRLPVDKTLTADTSTQEQAWLVRAAVSLGKPQARLAVTLDDRPVGSADPFYLVPSPAELQSGVAVKNGGTSPLWQSLTVYGVPSAPQPASRNGLTITRQFFDRAGNPLNLDAVKQNDVFVIVLSGEAQTKLDHQLLVEHGLPGGWEIENAKLGGDDIKSLGWLGELTAALTVEARDDRYVAAVALKADAPSFRLAYLVRAVTPGQYALPGAMVSDMYKPRFFARQAVGRVTVQPAP